MILHCILRPSYVFPLLICSRKISYVCCCSVCNHLYGHLWRSRRVRLKMAGTKSLHWTNCCLTAKEWNLFHSYFKRRNSILYILAQYVECSVMPRPPLHMSWYVMNSAWIKSSLRCLVFKKRHQTIRCREKQVWKYVAAPWQRWLFYHWQYSNVFYVMTMSIALKSRLCRPSW